MTVLIASLAALSSLVGLVVAVLTARRVPRLGRLPPVPEGARRPRVSVLLPARDEADTVEATLARLLAHDDVTLEIIVVDDRSTDATGSLLDAAAARDPRMRVIHINALPDGWLGKAHALDQARAQATGDWLVVMDADVVVEPGAIGRLVAWAEAEAIDFVTAFPRFTQVSPLVDAAVAQAMRSVLLGERAFLANAPDAKTVVGFGAFNLVRRAVFDRSEGFDWLRLEVADDLALATVMKRAGGRCAVVAATDAMHLTFYRSVGEIVRRLEKNAWAILGRCSLARVVAFVGLLVSVELLPFAAIALALVARDPLALGLAATSLVLALVAAATSSRFLGMGVLSGLLFPVGLVIVAFSQLRGGVIGFRRGGIQWRDTFYSSAQLRAGARVQFP